MSKKPARREKPASKGKEVEAVELPLDVPRELYEKLVSDVKRGIFKVLTPYSLAKEYNIKISTARKLLKIAAKTGVIKLYSGGRRTPIYVAS